MAKFSFKGVAVVGKDLKTATASFLQVIVGENKQMIVAADGSAYAANSIPQVKFWDPSTGNAHAKVLAQEVNLTLASDGGHDDAVHAYTCVCSGCQETILAETKLGHCILCASEIEPEEYEDVELDLPETSEIEDAAALACDCADEDCEDEDCEEQEDEAGDEFDEEEQDEDELLEGDELEEDEDEEFEEDGDELEEDEDLSEFDDSEEGDELEEDDEDLSEFDDSESGDELEDDDEELEEEEDGDELEDDEEALELEEDGDELEDEEFEVEDDGDEFDEELEDDGDIEIGDALEDDEFEDEEEGDEFDEEEEFNADEPAAVDGADGDFYVDDEGSVNIDLVDGAELEEGDECDVEFSASINGNKRWIASVNGLPVAFATEASAGENKDIFATQKFGKVVKEVLATSGLQGLRDIGFQSIVIAAPVKGLIRDAVNTEVASSEDRVTKQLKTLATDYVTCLGMASAGINRGFFTDGINPLKVRMWEELSAMGIPQPHRVIDRVFKETAEDYSRVLIEKANELYAKPREIRAELSKAIIGANYMAIADEEVVEEESPEAESVEESFARHIEQSSIPMNNRNSMVETASDIAVENDYSSKLKNALSSL